MLGFIFGFNARMSRVSYVLCSAVVNVASHAGMTLLAGMMIRLMMTTAQPQSGADMVWPLYGIATITTVLNFILRSMRLRDIGWNPVLVVPAWIALVIADKFIGATFPALAIGGVEAAHLRFGSGTVVGSLVDLALSALLVLMPSAEPGQPAPMNGRWLPDLPPHDGPSPQPSPEPLVAPVAPFAAATRVAAPTRPEFGRRRAGAVT